MDEVFGSHKRTVVYKLDESVDYINKGEEHDSATNLLT